MKRYLSLIIALLILASGIILTGCSSVSSGKSGDKALIDCLNKTKDADSMEGNLTSSTKIGGQSIKIEMNIKVEDIKKDLKSKVEMNMLGSKQVFYVTSSNGSYKVYAKDTSGNYTATPIDASQLNGMDITKSFDPYVELIQNNPSMVKETNNNTYELNIPKAKASEIYSKIAGNQLSQSLDSLKVKFVIGDDGYVKTVNVKVGSGSTDTEANVDYLNYNKKFDITIPNV